MGVLLEFLEPDHSRTAFDRMKAPESGVDRFLVRRVVLEEKQTFLDLIFHVPRFFEEQFQCFRIEPG